MVDIARANSFIGNVSTNTPAFKMKANNFKNSIVKRIINNSAKTSIDQPSMFIIIVTQRALERFTNTKDKILF